jgi:hypothetical protein
MAVLERQTMACVSRMFGGVRAGDLQAIEWTAFDTSTDFERGWAPRTKTARPQLLEVPEMLRPILRDWWERHGRPTTGPIFPVRKGDRAGEQRARVQVAAAMRRDLKRAFGIEVPRQVDVVRSNGRADVRIVWETVREVSPRERELFEPTEFTKPVDFHSFRRAFKQALVDAGVEIQTAMALSGASDAKAHQRYLANTSKMRRLPEGALPKLTISDAQMPKATLGGGLRSASNRLDSESGRRDSNPRRQPWQFQKTAFPAVTGRAIYLKSCNQA